jgi:hypothetical protein
VPPEPIVARAGKVLGGKSFRINVKLREMGGKKGWKGGGKGRGALVRRFPPPEDIRNGSFPRVMQSDLRFRQIGYG